MDITPSKMDLERQRSSPREDGIKSDQVPRECHIEHNSSATSKHGNDSASIPEHSTPTLRNASSAHQSHPSVPENRARGSFLDFFKRSPSQPQRNTYSKNDESDLQSEYEHRLAQWEHSEASYHKIFCDQGKAISDLEASLHACQKENGLIKEEYTAYRLKQQEEAFKRDSARWRPTTEADVTHKLERLKSDMRSWAKGTSIKDLSSVQGLEETQFVALMQELAQVALLENNQIPQGLYMAARSATLLLNALLAHSVYTSFFQSPFFFLKDSAKKSSAGISQADTLEGIYRVAEQSNKRAAYIWRSDTLRLLMPELRYDTSDAEKKMRTDTERVVARIAEQQASSFLAGPAQYLINLRAKTDFSSKLKKIFNEAASISFLLSTQRTVMRCRSLHDLAPFTFDGDCPQFTPDNLVRYEGQEERLKGSTVTLMVHPLLEVYGTDEAEDYSTSRVWAPGVVWFDNGEA